MSDSGDDLRKGGTFTFLSNLVLNSIIPILFILGFSGMGFGIDVVISTKQFVSQAHYVVEGSLALVAFMHIFDSQYWPTPIRIASWTSIFAAFAVCMCLLVSDIPYGPICIFMLLVPLSIFGIKNTFYENLPGNVVVGMTYQALRFIAGFIVIAFFYWCSLDGNEWDSETNAKYSHSSGCDVDFTDMENCENQDVSGVPCFFDEYYETITFSNDCTAACLDVYQACEEAFITWAFPGLAAMGLFVIARICMHLRVPNDPHASHQISALAKFAGFCLFLFWIFASMAGAGAGLSSSLIAFAIAMTIGSGIVFSFVFWESFVTTVTEDSEKIIGGVEEQAASYRDLIRGLVILGFTPFLIVYLLVSVVNQFVRRFFIRHLCKPRIPDAAFEHKGIFTHTVTSQIEHFLTWDHSQVLTYAVYGGLGYVGLNVLASKFTTLFLSWLIESTSDMNILAVTLIIFVVGMVLFMLPPIPGLPIYLTSGIVLVSVGREFMGLWGSIGYACLVSLLLKLFACGVQQKLIGGNLGGNIAVKQMVGLNSDAIRAMRVMLSKSGMSAKKVTVLVGGPDWPVSVLCGILGLDLFPILASTIPVVALIVPTVLTGSFAYMGSITSDDGMDLYPWADTMGAVASALTAGVMFVFTLSAAGAIKDTLEIEKDAIDAIPLDEAVREADAEVEKKSLVYRRVTVWSDVPIIMKAVLIAAVTAMMACTYLLIIFNDQCFREYDLMYTIDQHLGGNWTNLVLPLGRVALLFCAIGYGLLYVFESWATNKAKVAMEGMGEALTGNGVPTYV